MTGVIFQMRCVVVAYGGSTRGQELETHLTFHTSHSPSAVVLFLLVEHRVRVIIEFF